MERNIKTFSVVAMIVVAVLGLTMLIKPKNNLTLEGKETIVVEHEKGTTKVEKNPGNVVVFDYGILDALDFLGVKVKGVAQSSLPEYLKKYDDEQYVNIGSLKEPDFEAIYASNPDLIIISGRQIDFYDQLSEIAPTIYLTIDDSDYLGSFQKNMNLIGEIFNQEEAVTKELSKIETDVEVLKRKVEELNQNALITMINEGAVSVYGQQSRFGIIHNTLGFKPADENIEVSTHGSKVSFEYISQINPDYLFVVDRGVVSGSGSPAKAVLDNELIRATNAYKNDKIIYLDSVVWYTSIGGFTSTLKMIDEVATVINN